MDTNTAEIIKQLADKLGTTVDHVWPMIVQYTYANAVTDLVVGTLLAVGASVLWGICWRAARADDDRELTAMFSGMGALLCTFFAFLAIGTAIPAIASPEGYAISHMLGLYK